MSGFEVALSKLDIVDSWMAKMDFILYYSGPNYVGMLRLPRVQGSDGNPIHFSDDFFFLTFH